MKRHIQRENYPETLCGQNFITDCLKEPSLCLRCNKMQVMANRKLFLTALRSGEYSKGPIETDDRGRPLDPNAEGWCAIGLAFTLFCDEQKGSKQKMVEALGITSKQLTYIQQRWNDSSLTFPEIAELIETHMFGIENGWRC